MPGLLEQIQALVAAGRWDASEHGGTRRDERGLGDADLIHGVANATVVESYPDDDEGPSLLTLQHDRNGHPLHVVWGFDSDTGDALVITTYYPGLDRWEPGFMTRRRR